VPLIKTAKAGRTHHKMADTILICFMRIDSLPRGEIMNIQFDILPL